MHFRVDCHGCALTARVTPSEDNNRAPPGRFSPNERRHADAQMKNLGSWNRRVSAVYAVGVWSAIGSFAYVWYTADPATPKTGELQEAEDPNKVVHETAHNKTAIIYKENFVPYRERISNFFLWITGGSRPGTGDADK